MLANWTLTKNKICLLFICAVAAATSQNTDLNAPEDPKTQPEPAESELSNEKETSTKTTCDATAADCGHGQQEEGGTRHSIYLQAVKQDIAADALRNNALIDSAVNATTFLIMPDGENLTRITRSHRPLMYEFPHFLSKDESEMLISLAQKNGMRDSTTAKTGGQRVISMSPAQFQFEVPNLEKGKTFAIALNDRNNDGFIDMAEMRIIIEDTFDVYMQPDDVRRMFLKFGLDPDKDGQVTQAEIRSRVSSPQALVDHIHNVRLMQPELKGRDSQVTWMFPDKHQESLIQNLTDRVATILQLPRALVNKSDIQFVHYNENGFYNLHVDSGEVLTNYNCCTRLGAGPCSHIELPNLMYTELGRCRVCRLATFLIYLNDVPDGGDTAFPLADNSTMNITEFRQSFKTDLHYSCEGSRLRVQPRVGKAVLWYNHLSNATESAWFGDIDMYSYHGSCPVTKGEKWVANFWIKVTDDPEFDLKPTDDMRSLA